MPESLKVIDRPNHHLREPYFGTKRSKDKMEVSIKLNNQIMKKRR